MKIRQSQAASCIVSSSIFGLIIRIRFHVAMIQLISLVSGLNVDNAPIMLLPVYLTAVESAAFQESCLSVLESNFSSQQIILDFRQNTFLSSSGIGVIVTLYKAARIKGIELVLINVTQQAMLVLELTQLDKVFTIEMSDKYPAPATFENLQ